MIEKPRFSLTGLCAALGLTEEQMKAALATVEEARLEPITVGEVLTAFENVLRRFDEPEDAPIGAVLDGLVEYRSLLETGIALRAFAAGMHYRADQSAG